MEKINNTDKIIVLQEKLNKEGIKDVTFSDTELLVEECPNYCGLTQGLIDALWSIAGISPEDGNFIMDLNPELYNHIMINHTREDEE